MYCRFHALSPFALASIVETSPFSQPPPLPLSPSIINDWSLNSVNVKYGSILFHFDMQENTVCFNLNILFYTYLQIVILNSCKCKIGLK
jgi:hypothetical protein